MENIISSLDNSAVLAFCVKIIVIIIGSIVIYIIKKSSDRLINMVSDHDKSMTGIINTLQNHSTIITSLVEKTRNLDSFGARISSLEKAVSKLTETMEGVIEVMNKDFVRKDECKLIHDTVEKNLEDHKHDDLRHKTK